MTPQTHPNQPPSDWTLCSLGQHVTFAGGRQPPKSTFVFRPQNDYVRLIQIRDYKSDENATYIPAIMARTWCSDSDIMIGRYGPPIFQILRGITGAYNVALIKTILSPALDHGFLFHFLRQDALFRFVELLSRRSSGQTGVDLNGLREYPLLLPPLPEQRAIAAALSDVDALIASLDTLIKKKHDLKEAAAHALLGTQGTQTRINGFQAPWRTQKLGDIASIKTGRRNNEDKVPDGKYPFFVRSKEIERINSFSYDDEALLVPGDGGIGEVVHYIKGRFDVHQRVYCIHAFAQGISAKFVYYSMKKHFGPYAKRNSVKATVDSLRLPTLQNFTLAIPETEQEQNAVVDILKTFDADIEALEKRRDKTRLLKDAMSQALLTGARRLVSHVQHVPYVP